MLMETKLYTMIIYSENFAGILNQITAVFTRRQVNIESLNVCASSTPGVHKYTITCNCSEEMVKTLCKQIEKKIDVLQANYFTDDEIFIMEACLLKVSTDGLLQNPAASKAVRHRGARIVEVNPTFSIVEKKGLTDDIIALFSELNALGIVRQFVRSGRIAVTRDCIEHLDRYLESRTQKNS
jgi:acetolactate synthase-1/3 small subunit